MVLKLWDVDNGKVTYLKYTNSKNESRLVKLKDPIEPDRIPLSDMEKAIELMIRFVSSIKKLDNVGVVNCGKDDNIETKPGSNVEANKQDNNVDAKSDNNVDAKSDNKVDTKSDNKVEVNVEVKPDSNVCVGQKRKVETKPGDNVEKCALEEEYDKDNIKEVPQEVNDKLNLLLQKDEGRRDGVQFLINKNAKK